MTCSPHTLFETPGSTKQCLRCCGVPLGSREILSLFVPWPVVKCRLDCALVVKCLCPGASWLVVVVLPRARADAGSCLDVCLYCYSCIEMLRVAPAAASNTTVQHALYNLCLSSQIGWRLPSRAASAAAEVSTFPLLESPEHGQYGQLIDLDLFNGVWLANCQR